MSYIRSRVAERTVYLTLFDDPATAVLFSDLIVKYKKQGDATMSTKALTASDWINLGGGRYTLRFSAEEMDTDGNFVFTLESLKFDNFVYDEFQIEPPAGASGGGSGEGSQALCRVFGVIRDLSGTPMSMVKVMASPVNLPGKFGSNIISGNIPFTFTDSSGQFDLSLVRGATVIFSVERSAIRYQIEIPDASDVNILDLLPISDT